MAMMLLERTIIRPHCQVLGLLNAGTTLNVLRLQTRKNPKSKYQAL